MGIGDWGLGIGDWDHYAIELHILMDGDTSLSKAHEKASEVEELLRHQYGDETHVVVHVEPI